MADTGSGVKFRGIAEDAERSNFRKYRELTYGTQPLRRVLRAELTALLCGGTPGGPGLWLRAKLYPGLLGACGGKALFGRNVTLRHAHKIRLGRGVVIDDNCVLDAKGASNEGIAIGDNVYIGRNTIVYCKNGDIRIGHNVNISANCQVFSSNRLSIGDGAVIAAFCYFLSGGEYDYRDPTPFHRQSGMNTRGELAIGPDCWFGAGVTVLDAASVGERCVIGAGAVVTRPIPPHSLACGTPARVIRSIAPGPESLPESPQ